MTDATGGAPLFIIFKILSVLAFVLKMVESREVG